MIIPDVEVKQVEIKADQVVFDPEIYARMDPDQRLITEYETHIEQIIEAQQLIEVAADFTLIDGYHRWKAFQRINGIDSKMPALMHDTTNRDYIELRSYASNTRHGQRNKASENKRNVARLYARGFTMDQISKELGLSKSFVYSATTVQRQTEKEERNAKIVDLYMRAENTQEQIAKLMDTPRRTVADVIKNGENSTCIIFAKTFKPFLYNIWNAPKQDNARSHFGAFPEVFMENLLYYHTEPLDVVYDPFGGGGTTVDVCKRMFRRYYVSDRQVTPGRETDIREWQIQDGLPDNLPLPTLAFLDPPYWKQAEGKYSEDDSDLANMDLKTFNKTLCTFLEALDARRTKQIAIVIQPTQYKNDWQWTDHIFDFAKMLDGHYQITARYILPYSTQQYLPQMVEKAKEERHCLGLHRDLVVWSRT